MNPILGSTSARPESDWQFPTNCVCWRILWKPFRANKNPGKRIADIVRDRKVDKVVIGIPRHMSGEIGDAAKRALDFADELRQQLSCSSRNLG